MFVRLIAPALNGIEVVVCRADIFEIYVISLESYCMEINNVTNLTGIFT
jgi:hypothetical protein